MKLMNNRKFFVAGALFLAALFTTSCDDLVSNFDNPVSSYLAVSEADVVIPTGDTYQIDAKTINSDKPITFKSSDETIVTVDENGLVTGVADGEATITVSVEASEYYQAGELEVKVAVKRPLTFEALEDGTLFIYFNGTTLAKPIVYTIVNENGREKGEVTPDGSYGGLSLDVSKGDKVEFESANERLSQGEWNWGVRVIAYCKCAVYGNVMSMISPDGNYHTNKTITQPFAFAGFLAGNGIWEEIPAGSGNWQQTGYYTVAHDKYKLLLPATTLTTGCYYGMFYNTGFTEAPELPATELADYCYQWMFEACGDLTKAPELPAKEMKDGCYGGMFYNTGLTEAPVLPATTLAPWCYQNMFTYCTKLEKAPKLSVTKLADGCYGGMFSHTALKEAPALPATELKPRCYEYMFEWCTSLEKAPAISATKFADYSCQYMFNYNKSLKEAPDLKAETMATNSCLQMFHGCAKLEKAPALPATTLAYGCYSDMFSECTSLKKAPALPATTLADYCYNYMFGECTALTEAPELKAATLVDHCYCAMFMGCKKLSKVTCLATTNAIDALGFWLTNAGTDESVTTRTLVRAEANTNWEQHDQWDWNWGVDANWYVPTGWTIDPAITE